MLPRRRTRGQSKRTSCICCGFTFSEFASDPSIRCVSRYKGGSPIVCHVCGNEFAMKFSKTPTVDLLDVSEGPNLLDYEDCWADGDECRTTFREYCRRQVESRGLSSRLKRVETKLKKTNMPEVPLMFHSHYDPHNPTGVPMPPSAYASPYAMPPVSSFSPYAYPPPTSHPSLHPSPYPYPYPYPFPPTLPPTLSPSPYSHHHAMALHPSSVLPLPNSSPTNSTTSPSNTTSSNMNSINNPLSGFSHSGPVNHLASVLLGTIGSSGASTTAGDMLSSAALPILSGEESHNSPELNLSIVALPNAPHTDMDTSNMVNTLTYESSPPNAPSVMAPIIPSDLRK